MAESIDTAYVDIRPDFTGFAAATEAGIRRNLAGVSNAAKTLGKNTTSATQSLTALGGAASRAGTIAAVGVAGIGVAAGLAIKDVAQASIDFETAFSGVRKTVTATRPQLQAIRKDLLDLSTQIPVTAVELANIGEAAGQLGIATPAVASFTKVVAELGVTTNLTSDEAADALARIANITQLPQDKFENLGSVVVALGNKMAATESEIVDFGRRIAGAGNQVGLTVPEILSIGSALASVGIEAEAGGSAISNTISLIAKAVAGGGKKLQLFADVAGESADQFAKQFKTAPAQAIVAFVQGIGRVEEEGGNVFATLDKLGLGGIRVRQTLLNAAGAGDLLAKAIKTGDTAWQRNNALQREASIRFSTTQSKIQLLRNEVTALEIGLGDKLTPAIGEGAEALGGLVHGLRENEQVGHTLSDIAATIGRVWGAVFSVFRDNRDTFRDIFQNLGETLRVALVASKPFAAVLVGGIVVGLRIAIPLVEKITEGVRLMADIYRKAISTIVSGIDLFLGGLSSLADAASHLPLVGDHFKGVSDKIDLAREHLRSFVDDLNGVDGTTVTTEVKVKLPDLTPFSNQLSELQANAANAGKVKQPKPQDSVVFKGSKLKPLPAPKPGTLGGPPLANVPKTIQAVEQRLQDQVSLAQALDKSTANDKVALGRLAEFYDNQSKNQKLSVAIRRSALVKAAQTREQIRTLDQQAVENAQADSEAQANAAVAAADATTLNLRDDITARRRLIAVLQQRVVIAKQTGEGVGAAQAAVEQAQQDLAAKIREHRDAKLNLREEKARALIQVAQTTEKTLQDDIVGERALIAVLLKRVEVARRTKTGVQKAIADLKTERDSLSDLLAQQAQDRADKRLDAINDQKELASFTATKADDERALNAEITFWRKRVGSLKKGSVERRKAFVQLKRSQKDLRDLVTGATADSRTVGGTTLADLFTQGTDIAKQASLGQFIRPTEATDPIKTTVEHQLNDPTVHVRAVSDQQRQLVDSNDKLIDALDRLTTAVASGNAGANTGGGGTHVANPIPGPAPVGRFAQARRNAQLQRELSNGG